MKEKTEWNYEILVLCLLIIAGTVLRMYNLGFNSLWLDEAATYSLSVVPLDQIWTNMTKGEFNPPLFFVIEHLMLMTGNNEWALRFMPALFGIATIPVMYLVGKEFMDKYVGLIVATAVTLSPFLVMYSQEARAYSLMLLLCAGMMFFYLRAMKSNNLVDWLPFSLIAILAIWTHFYSFVFIVALVSYAAVQHRNNLLPLVKAMVIWFAFCLPIFYALFDLFRIRTATSPTYGIQGVGIIPETVLQLSGYSEMMALILIVLLTIGLMWSYFNAYAHGALIVWILGISLGASLVLSTIIPMMPRYMIFLVIPLYLGIALAYRPLVKLFEGNMTHAYALLCFVMLFALMGAPFYSAYYQGYSKEDWRGVAGDLANITSDGDVVITIPNYIVLPLGYYYNSTQDKTAFNGLSTREGLEVARQTIPNTTYYVVTPDIRAVDPHMQTGVWLMQNTQIFRTYEGVTILRSNPTGI
jgi:uncharacterized membrane protein